MCSNLYFGTFFQFVSNFCLCFEYNRFLRIKLRDLSILRGIAAQMAEWYRASVS